MWGTWLLRLWILSILIGGAVAVHTQAPLSKLHCPSYEQQTTDRAPQGNCATFDVLVLQSWNDLSRAIGGVIDQNRDDITAVSTLVVALFTVSLWYVTWRMVRIAQLQRIDMVRAIEASEVVAQAAEKSAEAALGVEIPRLAVQNIEFFDSGVANLAARLQFPQVAITIKNYGRTPAFLRQESMCFASGRTLPSKLEYDYAIDIPAGRTIDKDETYRLVRLRQRPSFDEAMVADILQGTTSLWVYGYIFYYDFLNVPRWFNFRASFQVPPVINGVRHENHWISEAPARRDDHGPEFGRPESGH